MTARRAKLDLDHGDRPSRPAVPETEPAPPPAAKSKLVPGLVMVGVGVGVGLVGYWILRSKLNLIRKLL